MPRAVILARILVFNSQVSGIRNVPIVAYRETNVNRSPQNSRKPLWKRLHLLPLLQRASLHNSNPIITQNTSAIGIATAKPRIAFSR